MVGLVVTRAGLQADNNNANINIINIYCLHFKNVPCDVMLLGWKIFIFLQYNDVIVQADFFFPDILLALVPNHFLGKEFSLYYQLSFSWQ